MCVLGRFFGEDFLLERLLGARSTLGVLSVNSRCTLGGLSVNATRYVFGYVTLLGGTLSQ